MAIRIITGAPGSGKSYYAVKHIRDNYCKYIQKQDVWVLKDNHQIITNLENLKLPHIDLNSAIELSKKNIYEFFQNDYQELISKKYQKLVYIIDESQRYFDEQINKYKDTVFFFEYHRHFGIDIYLLAQSYNRLSRKIQGLEEIHIFALSRTTTIFGEFKYNVMSGREIIDKKVLKKNKAIFELYKSRSKAETEKIKNPLIKYLLIVLAITLTCAIIFFNRGIFGNKNKGKKNHTDSVNIARSGESNNEKRISNINNEKIQTNVINNNYKNLYEIGYVKYGSRYQYYEPFTNKFLPQYVYPYKVISILHNSKRRFYIQVSDEDYQLLSQSELSSESETGDNGDNKSINPGG